jgi:DNA repair protein RadC
MFAVHDAVVMQVISVVVGIVTAHSIILMHNHPSGDANPSEADIRVTRDLIRAGQVLKIEVLDHVIVGRENHRSLRELGYFS